MKRFILMAALAVVLFTPSAFAMLSYSDGERAGIITKFSHKGFFCKTWEGELNAGGIRNEERTASSSDGKSSYNYQVTVPNTFAFTVEKAGIIAAIQNALATGKPVVLHYHQEAFVNPCRSNTGYFIDEVK